MALRTDIPTLVANLSPLFALARKGIAEVVISGVSYYKAEGQKRILGSDPAVMLIARSLLKPWQFLAADVAGSEPFWALGLASHSGQPHHMEQLQRLSAVAGAGESEIVCPRCFPLDAGINSMMRNAKMQPSRLHHPCSGKHLTALAACRHFGYPLERYWESDHPLQKRFANLIGQLVGERPVWMTDSCGLPTLAISAKAHLNLWERLLLSDDPHYQHLKNLWLHNIRLVGGYGRLESELMEATGGKVLAKEGADGLLVVAAFPTASEAAAVCLIKLASGYSATYLALALWGVLKRTPELGSSMQLVADYLSSRLETWVPGDQELILPPFAPPSAEVAP